eukprot:3111146-Rhodomonas_salina.1
MRCVSSEDGRARGERRAESGERTAHMPHALQELRIQVMPTRSPTLSLVHASPSCDTMPTPSWPGTSG